MKKILLLHTILFFLINASCYSAVSDSLSSHYVLKRLSELRNVNPAEGIKLAEKFLSRSDTSVKTKEMGQIYDELGVNYKKIARYSKALDYHDIARKIFERLNDTLGISYTLSNIGNIYRQMGEYESALQFYTESLKLKKSLGNKRQIAYTLNKIGMTFIEQNKNKEAERYLKQVLKLEKELNDSLQVANVYHSLASVDIKLGKFHEAEKFLEKALTIYTRINQSLGIGIVKFKKAKLYLKRKILKSALLNIKEAVNIFGSLNSKKYLALSYETESKIYSGMGNYKKALESYIIYADLMKKIIDNTSADKLNMYKELFSSELKEKENRLLKQQNKINIIKLEQARHIRNFLIALALLGIIIIFTIYRMFENKRKAHNLIETKNKELNKLNLKLNETNSTKDKLFSLISHDIRNPFATIINYSELFYKEFNELNDEEKIDFAKRIYFAATNVNDILDNILAWANSQRNNLIVQKKEIVIEDLFSVVKSKIDHVLLEKNIELILDVNCNKVVFTDEFMVQTIILNLLSNAIKYSHEGSKVILGHNCFEGNNKIFVRDFGVGIKSEKIEKLFHTRQISSEGTKNEKGLGIGLTICKEFSDKLGAKLRVESKLNEGTTFILELPLS